MGRIFEKRKDRMFARWAKTSKAFTKIGKEIAIAVKLGGPDPAGNPRLRMAIQTARSLNMPKDRIENAVKRASSKDEAGLEEISYEAYGPNGVAIYVEAATNNPTRTVANVRNIITKNGGNMTTAGALDFVFRRHGAFKIAPPKGDFDEFELSLIDHGLEELYEGEDSDLILEVGFSSFGDMQKFLESQHAEVRSAALQRSPLTFVELNQEQNDQLQKMVGLLEDDDDVQHVYTNMKSSD